MTKGQNGLFALAIGTAFALVCSSGCSGCKGSSGNGGGGGGEGGSSEAPPVRVQPGAGGPSCTPSIQAESVAQPTTVVGTGSAASCTENAFAAAVAKGGVITFHCGGAATIPITSTKELPPGKDTIIDGGGKVTLDGQHKVRILHLGGTGFQASHKKVVLQHISLVNGKATGTALPVAPDPCSHGIATDGGGGALWVRDAVVHVVDATFSGNEGATPGPDVAGGAIYVVGSVDTTIVGSHFKQNTASNGGAVGALFGNLTLANDEFEGNKANGDGGNGTDTDECTTPTGQVGNGGIGGAVVIDGGEPFEVTVCGSTFKANQANVLAGALARTADAAPQTTTINGTTFDGNTASGGGALYFHHAKLAVVASTFSGNSAKNGGALQADDTTLAFVNDTFVENKATASLGGAITLFSGGGSIMSSTFVSNHADSGSGKFGAAIAGGTKLDVLNTIFANQSSEDCDSPMTCAAGASTGANDLQWPQNHVACAKPDPACAAGTVFADPKLGALGANGGPTQTVVPAAGSPAIGAGKGFCPGQDQRGQPRKSPDGCTIGAVEAQ